MTEQTQQQKTGQAPIVHLTDAAIAKVKDMMKKEGKEGSALRVDVVTGGCAGLSYNLRFQKNPYENDIVFAQKDLQVFVNNESASFLKGIEIDYVDTLKVSGFQYRNPNAKSTCGCGTSFS
ncbi:MAG TPA: iron-sulfur cluster assembly accessory protein [Candidatus Omnitrophota bacterium]|nr:iron-sulfur cluster assembly accessory protein [Candidatus Omnitrophota bacterium]